MRDPARSVSPAGELRLIGRAALGLAGLAALSGGLALHALHGGGEPTGARAGATMTGSVPVVTSLRAGGAADRAGLRVGDVVERVDGHAPPSLAEVERAVASGAPADLRVRRDGREVDVRTR